MEVKKYTSRYTAREVDQRLSEATYEHPGVISPAEKIAIESAKVAIPLLNERITALEDRPAGGGAPQGLITLQEFQRTTPKEPRLYFISRDETERDKNKCWRIYFATQLVGEFDVTTGTITLPKFPMRFPFRLA